MAWTPSSTWTAFATPEIFFEIQRRGPVSAEEMVRVFNCGLGMVVALDASAAEAAVTLARASGVGASIVGSIAPRDRAGGAVVSDARERVREHLLAHSVRRGEFVLKSGRPSTWFIDSKQTICAPEVMVDVATLVLERIPDDATAIGGLTMGADGVSFITAGVAATRGRALRAFSVRKEVKDHGGGGRIAGVLEPGDRVVITEDTVTRGTSLLEAAHVVQDGGRARSS